MKKIKNGFNEKIKLNSKRGFFFMRGNKKKIYSFRYFI